MSEAYTYKCPDCGGVLEFDAASGMLFCNSCGQFYEVKNNEPNMNFGADDTASKANIEAEGESEDTMEMHIIMCKSCGARIMTGSVEATGTCIFCGQPTIFHDRVSNEYRPKRILPFKITKEQALSAALGKFESGAYLPDKPANLTTESVYGIYMPYWVYNITVSTDAHTAVSSSDEDNGGYSCHDAHLNENVNIALDASSRFSDYTSEFLNPFPINDAVPFDPSYLAGMFADMRDTEANLRLREAEVTAKEQVLNKWADKFDDIPDRRNRELNAKQYKMSGSFKMYTENDKFSHIYTQYVLLPVYFVTFRIKGEYTILLVNGATGKVVGSIPVDPGKVKRKQTIDMVCFGLLGAAIGAFLLGVLPLIFGLIIFAVIGASLILVSKDYKRRYEAMAVQTNSRSMFSISRNRR